MRLRRLDLARYGRFTDAAIDLGPREAGTPDLHILYGPNESGKSTAFSAWLDLLFGMRERHPYAFQHEWRRLRVAATLQDASGEHHLVRVGARGRDLFDAEDRPADPLALQAMLHGLGRDSYRLMLSLDEESLRQGGEAILASEGDLGRMLFSAAAGLSHLSDRLAALRAEAAEFHAPGRRKSRLVALRDRLKALKDEQAMLDTRVSEYRRLTEAFEAAETATAAAREARDAAAAEALRFERLARGHQAAARLAVAEEALRAHPPAPPVPEGLRAEADALRLDHAARLTEKSLAEKASEDAERTRAGVARDAEILAVAEEVTALLQDRPVVAKMAADRPKRQAELADARVALDELCRAAGAADRSPEAVEIDPPTLRRLDDLSGAAAGLAAAAAAAAAERARAEEALGEAIRGVERLGLPKDVALGPADPRGLAALRDRLREAAPAARLEGAAVALARARDDEAAALSALAPWDGDAEALRRLAVPDAAALARWQAEAAEMTDLEQARKGLLATLDAAKRASGAAVEGVAAVLEAAKAAERVELQRLAPFSGNAAALADQSPPRPEEVASWVAAEDRIAKAAAALAERRDQQAALAAEAVAWRDGLADDPGLVADDALAGARAVRDAAWQAHFATLSAETAARFKAALAAHDALLERRLLGVERSARFAEAALRAQAATAAEAATRAALMEREDAMAAQAARRAPVLRALGLPEDWSAAALAGWLDAREKALAALERVGAERDRAARSAEAAAAELAEATAALEAADVVLAARRTSLADAVRCAAVTAGLPSETRLPELASWLARREGALEHVAKRERAVSDHQAAEAAVAQAAAEVTALLAEDGAEPTGEMPLQRLLERLQARVDWRAGRAQEARAALDAREAASVEVRRRREASERADGALAKWRADWAAALSGLWLAGDDAAGFRERLPALRDLPAARRHLAELARR
ncbi:MAG: AAA family ATPase, partial [Pseudomonadota bacterium]